MPSAASLDGQQNQMRADINLSWTAYQLRKDDPEPFCEVQRTVSMIYFDAREVFASLLSCPTINQDKDFFYHGRDGAPFSEPLRTSDLGDIDNGRCYRRTHKALVRNPGFDMILPCIAGMDKTHIDVVEYCRLSPFFASGLLIHAVRSQPSAIRILGYINHSTPAHKPDESIGPAAFKNEFNKTDQ